MKQEIKGLVLKTVDYKDADKIVTILTDSHGKISAKAKGVRRKSSTLSAAVLPFTYCTFQLFKQGKNYTLDDADLEMQFLGLSKDILKLSLASYFSELCCFETDNTNESGALLRLALNSIYAVEKELCPLGIVKAVFELKCAQIWGYEIGRAHV